ncbi:hypothetical protein ElyMa_007010700 [Elysia marginata]|uniref:Uncharacterized protein n=1 Tax=Elysia marginata TaxID=1093978 RepID=A0AAV4JRI7_9GAST|nr:hypothetical protein ElyMa_007010700 [Elysia marginata]
MPLQQVHIEQISSKVESHGQAHRSKKEPSYITSCCSNRASTFWSIWGNMIEHFAMIHWVQRQQELSIQDPVGVYICQIVEIGNFRAQT